MAKIESFEVDCKLVSVVNITAEELRAANLPVSEEGAKSYAAGLLLIQDCRTHERKASIVSEYAVIDTHYEKPAPKMRRGVGSY